MRATRSPSTPSRALSTCFEAALRLYNVFPNAVFDESQLANVLGLSVTSSSLKGWLSDLKQYGLIEKNGSNEYTVPKILKEYSIADESEKSMIKYELAVRPKLFSQIIENQGNHLPDTATLANVLTARFSFNNTRALKVAKALRESLEWANAIDLKGNIIKPTQKHVVTDGIASSKPEGGNPNAEQRIHDDAQVGADDNDSSSFNNRYNPLLVTEVPLENGRRIRLQYPADTTEKEAEKACAVLKALCLGQ